LGDIIMATAMIRCVRKAFPNAQLDMVVRDDFFPLIAHNPHLNQKTAFPRKSGLAELRQLARQLDAEQYDGLYDAHGSLRSRFLTPLISAKSKKRFDKQYLSRSLALTFKTPLLDNRRFLEKFIDPLQAWGVQYDGLGPEVFLDPKSVESVKKHFHPAPEETWVGLIPSAQWPGKRWASDKFRELLALLVKHTSHHFVVFGGPSDDFCQQISAGMDPKRVLNLQSKVNLGEAMAAVKKLSYVIANDTGLMHVADALKVPSVLIFGPTSEASGCLPFEPRSVLVEHKLWCRPCSKNGQAPCIRGRRVCLERTSAQDVFAACMELERRLSAHPTRPLSWVVSERRPSPFESVAP
jgi:lipopolysaccharide heptosyltransferase II